MILPALNLGLSNVNWANPLSDDDLNRELSCWLLAGGLGYGSNKWFDVSPYQNNGTLTNMDPATDWVGSIRPGAIWALDFDGGDDYVPTTSTTLLDGKTSFTLSGWFNMHALSDYDGLVTARNGLDLILWTLSGGGDGSNNDIQLFIGDGSGFNSVYTTSSAITTNKWQYLTVTFKKPTVSFYVDAVSQPASGTINRTPGQSAVFEIGRDTGAAGRYLDALIGEIRIYDRALSPSEVRAIYVDSLQGYPRTLNRISVPLGKPPAASSVLPELYEQMPAQITPQPVVAVPY